MTTDRSNGSKLSETQEAILQKVLSVEKYEPKGINKVINGLSHRQKRIVLSLFVVILSSIVTDITYYSTPVTQRSPDDYLFDLLPEPYRTIASFLLSFILVYVFFKYMLPNDRLDKLFEKLF